MKTMQKIGKGLKDTFIEMSESLAGWIDDTGDQFMGNHQKQTKTKNSSTKAGSKKTSSSK